MFRWFRKQMHVVVEQTVTGEGGKRGRLTMDGVASLDTREGTLYGKDRTGRVVLILPLDEVAMAMIVEKPNGS